VNRCQEEFEKENVVGHWEEALGKNTPKEEKELIRIRAKKRMLGNFRFIGELYRQKMLPEKIIHECLIRLLGDIEKPDEARAARRPPPPAAARPSGGHTPHGTPCRRRGDGTRPLAVAPLSPPRPVAPPLASIASPCSCAQDEVECLCELMTTVGPLLDHARAKAAAVPGRDSSVRK